MVMDKENTSDRSESEEKNPSLGTFGEKGIHFLGKSVTVNSDYPSCQELTLSYLCENSKGKQLMVCEDENEESKSRWVERDFLQLSDTKISEEDEEENREKKKPKVETLNLSLALPDVSLSLAGSNRDAADLQPSRSVHSHNNAPTRTAHSNAASFSYSYSHPLSHNPSCSLTRNSTDYSAGSHHIWNGGEGTNGSVHSRFRPIIGGGVSFALGSQVIHKETCNDSIYRTTSSDNVSFFPSELPAKPRIDDGDSRGRGSESLRGLESMDGGRARKISRPERILREIVSESVPLMAQIAQELPDETVESTKEYLSCLITNAEKKDELVSLQNRINRRCDLTSEALTKCHRIQLEFLVAIKMGLVSFLSSKQVLPTTELVEIFLLERCRNTNCKRVLPVEDCECKICSAKKGFCSECMCPVCLNFDCASNTCSWVGCDACSHWCHAVCGIQKNLIKPGLSFNGGPCGTTEMQFYCLGCGHASEMFGFVKDVFTSCAREWGEETLMKELDCVQKIFQGSEDYKGKELHVKANELRTKLQKKMISPPDVCNFIFQFFNYTDGMSNFPSISSKAGPEKDAVAPKSPFYSISSSSGRKDAMLRFDERKDVKVEKMVEDEWSVKQLKKRELDSLESIVRIKEAEAKMFQNRADDARREAEGFKRVVRMKSEKLDEEYSEKLGKLGLQEIEERRKKKLGELKVLENSHCDYYNMKMRMQSEIAGMLKRMEATKQLWV